MRKHGTALGQAPGRTRVALGLGLIAAAGILAWQSQGSAHSGTAAWMVQETVPAQAEITAATVSLTTVQIPDPAVLWPDGTVPTGAATRTLRPGELILATDVGAATEQERRAVTLPVEPERIPQLLTAGDIVDVWSGVGGRALLTAVTVQSVAALDVGPGRVDVMVPSADVAAAVRAAVSDQVVLVRHP